MIPVIIPLDAPGITIETIIRHFGMPKARPASRTECGTNFSISSVERTTTGIIIIPKAMPAAQAEKCFIGTTIAV